MSTNRIQITDLDFDSIKENLKDYLRNQSEFSDYDFEGSSLNVLLDILAYNTHYNAYYLNMVSNEAFLDTAILRDSIVSHAKLLSYVPRSVTASKAVIDLTVQTANSTPDILTLPRGFSFDSNPIDNTVYNFVLLDEVSAVKTGQDYVFFNLDIFEGDLISYNYTFNESSNPKGIFSIPNDNVDTATIVVTVQDSSTNLSSSIFTIVTDVTTIDGTAEVYFLQEGKNGNYEIYFGNGNVGKKINDGSIINISYLVTSGSLANKAANFVISSSLGPINSYSIDTVTSSSGGDVSETSESIKRNAIAQHSFQNRLVTTKDYEFYILRNYPPAESISVWGGEEEVPPIYGKVFISIKPKDNYFISETEKQRIINELISPRNVVTASVEIRDPDYLYLKLENKVVYNARKTSLNESQLKNSIRNAIINYKNTNLKSFASTFVLSKVQDEIDLVDLNAIIGSETILRIEKRIEVELEKNRSYQVKFNTPLKRGSLLDRLSSSEFQVFDNNGVIQNAIVEEIPESFTGISNIQITNPGYNYEVAPNVIITGDGFGATAEAKIVNGRVQNINITNRGINYTKAIISFSGGQGFGAEAVAVLDARFGTLRTVYFNELAERITIQRNAGSIDYETGELNLTNIRFLSVGSSDGLLRFNVGSESGIISSIRNTIITIDESDPSSIITELVSST